MNDYSLGSDLPESQPRPVIYCGITFGSDAVSGTGVNGVHAEIVRSDIKGLAIHAVVPRGAAVTQTIWSILLFGIAGWMGLGAVRGVYVLGHSVVGRGFHFAIMISLLGTATRLLSTAWDPRHLLAVTTSGDGVILALRPTPEPFELIKTIEEVEQRLGYAVDLYPDKGAANA